MGSPGAHFGCRNASLNGLTLEWSLTVSLLMSYANLEDYNRLMKNIKRQITYLFSR